MKIFWIALFTATQTLLVDFNPVAASEHTVADQIAEGIFLIESNCYKCYGATKEDMERGVSILEKLHVSGVEEVRLLSSLAMGYRDLALTYYSRGSEERRLYLRKEAGMLSRAVSLNPNDLDILNRFIETLPRDKKIEELEKIHEVSIDASIKLGMIYFYENINIERGIALLKQVYEQSTGHSKIAYGEELLSALYQLKDKSEYRQFKRTLQSEKEQILLPQKMNGPEDSDSWEDE